MWATFDSYTAHYNILQFCCQGADKSRTRGNECEPLMLIAKLISYFSLIHAVSQVCRFTRLRHSLDLLFMLRFAFLRGWKLLFIDRARAWFAVFCLLLCPFISTMNCNSYVLTQKSTCRAHYSNGMLTIVSNFLKPFLSSSVDKLSERWYITWTQHLFMKRKWCCIVHYVTSRNC